MFDELEWLIVRCESMKVFSIILFIVLSVFNTQYLAIAAIPQKMGNCKMECCADENNSNKEKSCCNDIDCTVCLYGFSFYLDDNSQFEFKTSMITVAQFFYADGLLTGVTDEIWSPPRQG